VASECAFSTFHDSLFIQNPFSTLNIIGRFTPANKDDTFEFEPESPLHIDNIVVNMSDNADDWQLNLIYPSSARVANLVTSTGGNWTLNNGSTAKQWFEVPAKTILQWKADATTPSETVTMLVVGE